MAAGIAVLQPAREDDVEGRTRDDAELARAGDRTREAPSRDADSHPALDDRGQRVELHALTLSPPRAAIHDATGPVARRLSPRGTLWEIHPVTSVTAK